MCAEAFETLQSSCHLLPITTRLAQFSTTTVLTEHDISDGTRQF